MANYTILKNAIQQVVKQNGNNEITGALLQQSLLSMIDSLGAGYQFVGVATPSTNPGTPDQNVFYLAAEKGTYSNFTGAQLDGTKIAVFRYSGSWSVSLLDFSMMHGALAGCDLNTVQTPGVYFLYTSQTYQNSPNNLNIGFLRVSKVGAFVLQEFYEFSASRLWKRRLEADLSVVNPWVIVNSQYVDELIQSVNERVNEYFYFLALSYTNLCEKTKQTPSSVVTGKLIDQYGVETTNASMQYQIFPVQSGKQYAFDGKYAYDSTGVPYVVWFDSNNQFIRSDFRRAVANKELKNEYLEIPSNAAYAYLNVQTAMIANFAFKELGRIIDVAAETMRTRDILPSGSLADVRENGLWLLATPNTYQDMPVEGTSLGFLRVSLANNIWGIQEFYTFSTGELYQRRFEVSGPMSSWQRIGGGGGTEITNNYTFNEYQQTVNVTATPTINTDTNQYLAASGDTTDRTADILTLLNNTGVCRLGPGDFYVKNLVMPNQTMIIGSGPKTRVLLDSFVTDGFAIKIGSECLVKDFWLKGSYNDIVPNSTVGTRHGLLWQGNYTQSQTAPTASMVTDMIITDFHGGGITCYDTGYGTYNFLNVSNVNINGCDAGINISYWSEFHKFTNVRTCFCHYGCINNGGNNVFVNCDFSSCRGVALKMDNSQGQSPNGAHGSCVGCVFNHTANNAGIGIEILGFRPGFTFVGCQIFYSQIHLENSNGIIFDGCNCGYANCDINISGGGTVIFTNNMWEGAIPISIVNNSNVHFVNCYDKATGAVISA